MDAAAEEVVRTELIRHRLGARLLIRRGALTLASIPLVFGAAALIASALVDYRGWYAYACAGLYTMVAGSFGWGAVVNGIAHHRDCTKQLRGLDARRQLPEARLLR